jgi:hypothetical protein
LLERTWKCENGIHVATERKEIERERDRVRKRKAQLE